MFISMRQNFWSTFFTAEGGENKIATALHSQIRTVSELGLAKNQRPSSAAVRI